MHALSAREVQSIFAQRKKICWLQPADTETFAGCSRSQVWMLASFIKSQFTLPISVFQLDPTKYPSCGGKLTGNRRERQEENAENAQLAQARYAGRDGRRRRQLPDTRAGPGARCYGPTGISFTTVSLTTLCSR